MSRPSSSRGRSPGAGTTAPVRCTAPVFDAELSLPTAAGPLLEPCAASRPLALRDMLLLESLEPLLVLPDSLAPVLDRGALRGARSSSAPPVEVPAGGAVEPGEVSPSGVTGEPLPASPAACARAHAG